MSTGTVVSFNLDPSSSAEPEIKASLGAVWGQGGSVSAVHGARDVISIMAITRDPAFIRVAIGECREMTFRTHNGSPISYFEMPFDSHTTGAVEMTLNGRTTRGPEIMCESGCEKVSPQAMSCESFPWLNQATVVFAQCCCHPGLVSREDSGA